jgi:hypothetical protein
MSMCSVGESAPTWRWTKVGSSTGYYLAGAGPEAPTASDQTVLVLYSTLINLIASDAD